jgi:hypothetical protein
MIDVRRNFFILRAMLESFPDSFHATIFLICIGFQLFRTPWAQTRAGQCEEYQIIIERTIA